jgi:hypothetical protein
MVTDLKPGALDLLGDDLRYRLPRLVGGKANSA